MTVAASALVQLARQELRTSLASTSQGEDSVIWASVVVRKTLTFFQPTITYMSPWVPKSSRVIFIKSISFRCEECPLLEDEDDISDEEMEQLVRMFFSL